MFGTKVRLTLERAVRRGSWTIWTSWLFNLVDLSHEHDATVVQRITSVPVEISDKLCDQTIRQNGQRDIYSEMDTFLKKKKNYLTINTNLHKFNKFTNDFICLHAFTYWMWQFAQEWFRKQINANVLLTEYNILRKKWFYKHFTNSFLCKNDFMSILQAIYKSV